MWANSEQFGAVGFTFIPDLDQTSLIQSTIPVWIIMNKYQFELLLIRRKINAMYMYNHVLFRVSTFYVYLLHLCMYM